MFRRFAAATFIAVQVLAPDARADSMETQASLAGTYVTVSVGGPFTTKQDFDDTLFGKGTYEPDWGLGGTLEIGRYIGPNWRMGLELGFIRGFDGELKLKDLGITNKLDGHSDVFTGLVHVYYTICELDTFVGTVKPFVGAGIGFAHYDVKEFGNGGPGDKTDTAFAAALHAGYDIKLRDGVTMTSRYSLGYTGEAEFGQVLNATTTKQEEIDFLGYTGLRFDLN